MTSVLRRAPGGADPARSAGQLVRYVIVGAAGYALAMGIFAAELALGVSPFAAVPLPFVANGLFNFWLNRVWSFPASGRPVRSELSRFGVVAGASLIVNYGVFYLLLEVAGMPPLPAQALAIIVATPVGFIGNKVWSFGAA